MKILHVADFLPGTHSHIGGAEYAAYRIITEQTKSNFDIEVATLPVDIEPTEPQLWQKHHILNNIDRYAPKIAYAIKQMYFPGDFLARKSLKKIISQSKPDLIHFHNLHYSGLSIIKEAKSAGIPTILSIYDYWIFCPAFMLTTNNNELCSIGHSSACVDCIGTKRLAILKPFKKMLFHWRKAIFEHYTDAVDKFFVLSNASKSLLQHHHIDKERVSVLHQYIWPEAAEKTRIKQPIEGNLTYVGWVEHRKGLHIIVSALAQLADEFPQLQLEVIGMHANTKYENTVNKIIADNNLQDRVTFKQKISRESLLQSIHDSWLVTIPEQWENMSPVILTEAMAAGACVLASRIGGISHIVEENHSGLLAEHDNISEYVEKIRWAISNPDKINSIRVNAKNRAKKLFNPLKINMQMEDIYSQLIQ